MCVCVYVCMRACVAGEGWTSGQMGQGTATFILLSPCLVEQQAGRENEILASFPADLDLITTATKRKAKDGRG